MRFSGTRILAVLGLALVAVLPARGADLIMVEQPGCHWCAQWNAEISQAYPKSREGIFAPLQRLQLANVRNSEIHFDRPIVFTPTFVLVEQGQELARIEGYPGQDFFWGLLDMILVAHTGYSQAEG